jgi:hypothetical protein
MNIDKINNLTTTVKALNTARFYTVNGWGIVSFKSDLEFTASKNATCFMTGGVSTKESIDFVKELNEAIKPVLEKYSLIAEALIKEEVCSK